MVGELRPIARNPSVGPSQGLATSDPVTGESWGASDITSDRLRRVMNDLQADLHGLVDDLQRGPLARLEKSGQDLLSELRLTFLRVHRRLTVHVRSEGGAQLTSKLRDELEQLANALRIQVLARASRATHEGWSPVELSEALDRVIEGLPAVLRIPVDPDIYRRKRPLRVVDEMQRGLALSDRWIRRVSGDVEPQREVELRSFLSWHLYRAEMAGLEGLAVLLVQVEAHLERRARSLFALVVETFEGLIAAPDELEDNMTALRQQVEDELGLAEQELRRFLDDIQRRARGFLAAAVRSARAELPSIGTYRLHNRARAGDRLRPERKRWQRGLDERLVEVRKVAASGYVLFAVSLELTYLEARVKQLLEPAFVELDRQVRGRSSKQLDRLGAELEAAIAALDGSRDLPVQEGAALPEEGEAVTLERVVSSLERVLRDAQRAAQQLVDVLTSAEELNKPLELLTKTSRELTKLYRVPEARLAHTEWTLPRAPEVVDLPFSSVVETFVETDVAPALLALLAHAASNVEPIMTALEEVARVVSLGGGQLEGEDALVRESPQLGDTREVLVQAFRQARDELGRIRDPVDKWARELGRNLRTTARARFTVLEHRLDEGGIAQTAAEGWQLPDADPRDRFRAELGRISGLILGLRQRSTSRVRRAVGEERIAGVRRALGLPRQAEVVERNPFEPPAEPAQMPPFYRRLFAGQATWAGDVLEEAQDAVRVARTALTPGPRRVLRAAAVVGTDGAGRRALVGALTRGDRFGSMRRLAFVEPSSPADVERAFSDLSAGQLVVITGLSWLLSAEGESFAAVRALATAVLADRGKNAFLVEADRLAWSWACSAAPLDEVFGTIIEARALDPRELEMALIGRHRLSGLELVYDSSDPKEVAQPRFFRRLHEASDGLLQVAVAYWLGALEEVNEARGIARLGAVPGTPHEALRQLPVATLHVLYLVARQGWMSPSGLAELLGRARIDAEAILLRLEARGLVERASAQVFVLRRHLCGPLQRVLTEKGWV